MSGHTPGPWAAKSYNGGVTWKVETAASRQAVVSSTTTIAALASYIAGLADTCEANARLIAAAPELLAALHELVACNEHWNKAAEHIIGRPPTWSDAYLTVAHAAIAKAEGR